MPSDPGDVRPRTSALSVYSTRETTRAWTPFAKRHGVSEQTIYSWRKRYGEFDVADVRRLCELEQENARLLNGKAGISPSMALALERIGWSNASFWMRLQAAYELAQERRRQAA